jgi:hypothetical protein
VSGNFKTQDYWTNLFLRVQIGTIKIFFPKKITIRFFSGTLTAVRYLEIIQQFLEQYHDDVFVKGYFQQDGAPTHTTYETLNIIQEMYRQDAATSLCATSFCGPI